MYEETRTYLIRHFDPLQAVCDFDIDHTDRLYVVLRKHLDDEICLWTFFMKWEV